MSTKTSTVLAKHLTRGVLAVVSSAAPALAADIEFRPLLSFGLFYDGNVRVVDYDPATGQRAEKLGDSLAAVSADLRVDRRTPGSSLVFFYRPTYHKYRTASEFDYFGNAVELGYQKEFSRRNELTTNADLSRTDTQGTSPSHPDRATTFVPRTTITFGHVDVGGTIAAASRGLLDWQARAGATRYDHVDNVTFVDSTSFGVRGGWRYELSERSTTGLAFDADLFRYDSLPDVAVERLVFCGTHRPGRTFLLTFSAGASRASSSGESSIQADLDLGALREISEESELTAGVRQTVSPGTGLQGPTLDRGGWIGYVRHPDGRGLTGSLIGGYWHRAGLTIAGPPIGDTSTLDVTGSLGWNFNRFVSLHAAAAFHDQTVDQVPGDSAASALETRYGAYGLYVTWAITGRSAGRQWTQTTREGGTE